MYKDTTKRICGNCQTDTTGKGGLREVRDLHGNTFALIGDCCLGEITQKMKCFSSKYGAFHIDGVQVASPKGSPYLNSIDQLNEELNDA